MPEISGGSIPSVPWLRVGPLSSSTASFVRASRESILTQRSWPTVSCLLGTVVSHHAAQSSQACESSEMLGSLGDVSARLPALSWARSRNGPTKRLVHDCNPPTIGKLMMHRSSQVKRHSCLPTSPSLSARSTSSERV